MEYSHIVIPYIVDVVLTPDTRFWNWMFKMDTIFKGRCSYIDNYILVKMLKNFMDLYIFLLLVLETICML